MRARVVNITGAFINIVMYGRRSNVLEVSFELVADGTVTIC